MTFIYGPLFHRPVTNKDALESRGDAPANSRCCEGRRSPQPQGPAACSPMSLRPHRPTRPAAPSVGQEVGPDPGRSAVRLGDTIVAFACPCSNSTAGLGAPDCGEQRPDQPMMVSVRPAAKWAHDLGVYHPGDGLRQYKGDVVVDRVGVLVGDGHRALLDVHGPPVRGAVAFQPLADVRSDQRIVAGTSLTSLGTSGLLEIVSKNLLRTDANRPASHSATYSEQIA